METWYSLPLGDGMMASGPAEQIETRFMQLYRAAGRPSAMAVFTRPESEGRLHCEVIAYFSPAAFELAEELEADPCNRPVRAGLGLLAGDEACWSILFPDHG